MTSTLKQRFAALEELKPDISQAALARATGAKSPSVNAWFSGATKSMRAETAAKVAALYGVSPVWLATGEGEMLPPAKSGGLDHEKVAIHKEERALSHFCNNLAPVFEWHQLGEVLLVENVFFADRPQLPVPEGAGDLCKWFTLDRDMPRLHLTMGSKVAIKPVEHHECRDGQLCLFRTVASDYILGDFRRLADGYEALPDSGYALDSVRHGVHVVGVVQGTWFS